MELAPTNDCRFGPDWNAEECDERGAFRWMGQTATIVIEAAAPNGLMVDYPHYARFLRGVFPATVGGQ